MSERMCAICDHPESSHYTYSRNGRRQGRCVECDPFSPWEGGNYEIVRGSEQDYMNQFADHEFATLED